MFLALLLSSFGGDALNNDGEKEDKGDEDQPMARPRKTRLQRLMEWTKKKKKNKKKLLLGDQPGFGDTNAIEHVVSIFATISVFEMTFRPSVRPSVRSRVTLFAPLVNGSVRSSVCHAFSWFKGEKQVRETLR